MTDDIDSTYCEDEARDGARKANDIALRATEAGQIDLRFEVP
jgi:hypothetical protein